MHLSTDWWVFLAIAWVCWGALCYAWGARDAARDADRRVRAAERARMIAQQGAVELLRRNHGLPPEGEADA